MVGSSQNILDDLEYESGDEELNTIDEEGNDTVPSSPLVLES